MMLLQSMRFARPSLITAEISLKRSRHREPRLWRVEAGEVCPRIFRNQIEPQVGAVGLRVNCHESRIVADDTHHLFIHQAVAEVRYNHQIRVAARLLNGCLESIALGCRKGSIVHKVYFEHLAHVAGLNIAQLTSGGSARYLNPVVLHVGSQRIRD